MLPRFLRLVAVLLAFAAPGVEARDFLDWGREARPLRSPRLPPEAREPSP